MNPEDLAFLKTHVALLSKDKCTVRIRVPGNREMVLGDVRIRVDPNFALAMHIDTDEANAANLRTGAQGFIDGIQHED